MKKHLLFIFVGLFCVSFIKAQCSVNFTYSISASTVSVTAVTTATGTTFYAWQWGDAMSVPGSGQSASHTYSTSGSYSLCLTYVEFAFPPCTTQVCQNIVIGSVGVKEHANNEIHFRVSPNPAKSFVNVDYTFTRPSKLSIHLFDVAGKLIDEIESEKAMEAGTYNKHYSLLNLSAGIYFIRVKTENGVESKKLIIN